MTIGMKVRHCLLGVAFAACMGPGSRSVMDDSTFVATVARLHAIDRNFALSDAARDSLRRRVLQEQGLTVERLEQQARHYADDPARAAAIWTAISRKSQEVGRDTSGRDTSRRDPSRGDTAADGSRMRPQ